jgi:hypothetical protein
MNRILSFNQNSAMIFRLVMVLNMSVMTQSPVLAQRPLVVGGIGIHYGGINVKNGLYTRNYQPVPDSDPEVTYTDLRNLKTSTTSIGLNLAVLGKKWLFDLDLNYATKTKTSYFKKNVGYVLNFGLARGKMFKEKFGFFLGGSLFSNLANINGDLTGVTNAPEVNYSGPAIVPALPRFAGVVKLVDTLDLGSSASRHGGSSPSTRTQGFW